jgi:hypothetical protein
MSEQMSTGAMANEIRRAIIADRSDQYFAALILADRKATVEKCKAKLLTLYAPCHGEKYSINKYDAHHTLDAILEEESE